MCSLASYGPLWKISTVLSTDETEWVKQVKSLQLQGAEQRFDMLHRATHETQASMWFRASYKMAHIEKI